MKTGTGSAFYSNVDADAHAQNSKESNFGTVFFWEIMVAQGPETGVLRRVRTKLRDGAVRLVIGGCYFQVA